MDLTLAFSQNQIGNTAKLGDNHPELPSKGFLTRRFVTKERWKEPPRDCFKQVARARHRQHLSLVYIRVPPRRSEMNTSTDQLQTTREQDPRGLTRLLIPSKGTYLGCGPIPSLDWCGREPIDFFSHIIVSLSPFFSPSLCLYENNEKNVLRWRVKNI